jgi:hypothetical protein
MEFSVSLLISQVNHSETAAAEPFSEKALFLGCVLGYLATHSQLHRLYSAQCYSGCFLLIWDEHRTKCSCLF